MSDVIEFTPRTKAPAPPVARSRPKSILAMQISYEGMSLNLIFNKDPAVWHRHKMHLIAKMAMQAKADREHAERLALQEAEVVLLDDFKKDSTE